MNIKINILLINLSKNYILNTESLYFNIFYCFCSIKQRNNYRADLNRVD